MRYIKLLKTSMVNRLWFFPFQKIKALEKEIARLESRGKLDRDNYLNSLVHEYLRENNHERKTKKESIQWHAILRKKLRDEIGHCEICGATHGLTLDHIIPQSFIRDLGLNPDYDFNPNNFRLLCMPCNSKKSSHFDFKDPRTIVLIQQYIKRSRWHVNIVEQTKLKILTRKPKADVILDKPQHPDI